MKIRTINLRSDEVLVIQRDDKPVAKVHVLLDANLVPHAFVSEEPTAFVHCNLRREEREDMLRNPPHLF